VSPPSYRRIYVSATRPDLQAIEHFLEKNRDVDIVHSLLSLCIS